MRLYHDTTARVRPESAPAHHGQRGRHRQRHPQTPDGRGRASVSLSNGRAISGRATIFCGARWRTRFIPACNRYFPYESDDLGGHVANPTPEQYIRWIEYGALSPVYRPHCTHNLERMPWVFGPEAENVARQFRESALPAAARSFTPPPMKITRPANRCFAGWIWIIRNSPKRAERRISAGQIHSGRAGAARLAAIGPGRMVENSRRPARFAGGVFCQRGSFRRAGVHANGRERLISTGTRKAPRRISRARISRRAGRARLKCRHPVGDVKLATLEDDGARVWIDGQPVIDAWGGHDSATSEATAVLTAGVPHQIRIEYLQLDFGAHLKLLWQPAKCRRQRARRGFRRATGLTPGTAKSFPVP